MSNIDRDRDLPLNRTDDLRDRVEDEARLTLSEEELALRKERVDVEGDARLMDRDGLADRDRM